MTLATRVAGPIVVAAIAFGAYLGGVMPGVGFWDTAEFQTVLPILGTAHSPGFPTYVLIGWVANAVFTPLGEPAFRMNVLSAILVAIAAGATVVLVGRLTQRRIWASPPGSASRRRPWPGGSRRTPTPMRSMSCPERAARADRSADLGAGPWLDAALGAFERDAVVVSWWSYSTALWYAQHIEGRRPDVWVVDDRTRLDLGDVIDVIDANFDTRPIYLIREDRLEIVRLRDRYVVERLGEGHLFGIHRVIARSGQTP